MSGTMPILLIPFANTYTSGREVLSDFNQSISALYSAIIPHEGCSRGESIAKAAHLAMTGIIRIPGTIPTVGIVYNLAVGALLSGGEEVNPWTIYAL